MSLFDGYNLLAICTPCLKSVDTPACYEKNPILSRSINVLTCFMKEFITLLNILKNYSKCIKQHDMDQIAVNLNQKKKKETGIQALFRHSLILLLWQVSELNWAFVS